jgi:xanthine dehydrogenase accessory factor
LAGSKSELLKTSAGRPFSEPLNDVQPQLFLFGAGHVGREIVHILGRHRLKIYWLDQRSIEFPAIVPNNTRQMFVSE